MADLREGCEVLVYGLQERPWLNGKKGVVGQQRTVDGGVVYDVDFPPPDGRTPLPASNLRAVDGSQPDGFEVGDLVEAHSLVSQTSLNGVKGAITGTQSATDGTRTYVVQFGSPYGTMALREANLRRAVVNTPFTTGTKVTIKGLVSQPSLNGLKGTVTGHRFEENAIQVIVNLPPPHGKMAVPEGNLEKRGTVSAAEAFPVQSTVEAHSLKQQASINGERGRVVGHRHGADGGEQVIVQFEKSVLAIRPANLKLVGSGERVQFQKGCSVVAHGLRNQQALNGVRGVVQDTRRDSEGIEQIVVQFPPPHGILALRAINVKIVSPPTSSAASSEEMARILKEVRSLRAPPLPPVTYESFLNKKTPSTVIGRDYDRRWFTLRGQTLVFYEEKGRINLSSNTAVVPMTSPDKTLFSLADPSMARTYELKADTSDIAAEWIRILSNSAGALGAAMPQLRILEALETAARKQVEIDMLCTRPEAPTAGGRTSSQQDVEELRGVLASKEAEIAQCNSTLSQARGDLERAHSDLATLRSSSEAHEAKLHERIRELEAQLSEARSREGQDRELLARAERAEQRVKELELELRRENPVPEVSDVAELYESPPSPSNTAPQEATAPDPSPSPPSQPERHTDPSPAMQSNPSLGFLLAD